MEETEEASKEGEAYANTEQMLEQQLLQVQRNILSIHLLPIWLANSAD